jgi:hypothetical protein
MDEQIGMLERGELDLGAMVIDENTERLMELVRDRHLQIVDIPSAEVFARRLPFTRAGVIRAGTYDPVHVLPAEDKRVIQVETLVVGNGTASWSATQGLITVLLTEFPDFVQLNRGSMNRTGLPMAPAAQSYFDNNGPDVLGVYAPWLVDLLPTARWIQLVFGISILFNAMAFAHRFRLWRIDARRVRLESRLPEIFGHGVTVGEIAAMEPEEHQHDVEMAARLDRLVEDFGTLLERCRKHSLSVLVPMGQEMGYRYQEVLIVDWLRALRIFRSKLEP